MSPGIFLATESVRRALFDLGFANFPELARATGMGERDVEARIALLEGLDYVEAVHNSFALTEEGRHSVHHSAPPLPDNDDARWPLELLRALSVHYRIEVSDVLGAEVGPAVLARARLCHALHARGWSHRRIEAQFSFRKGWAEAGVQRWLRVREREGEAPRRSVKRTRRYGEEKVALARVAS